MFKRVLITGGAGFIGYHLSQALKKRGDSVLCFDNFNSYYSTSLKRMREERLRVLGIETVEGELTDLNALLNTCKNYSPTHIVHLAAQAGVRYSLECPQAYIDSNIQGFLNVLECVRKNPQIPLTYASSSSVYGTNAKIPYSTEDFTDQPASLYGATKKSNEVMAHAYHHCFGIKVTGLRYFTVYGSWGRPDMAYWRFLESIYAGKPIEVFNQGQLERDFTYIDDIIEGSLAAIDLQSPCEIFNLGGHYPVQLETFISILEELSGCKAIKKYVGMQRGDVLKTFADIDKSKQMLNFSPKISLEEGLSRFVSWYRENIL